MNDETPLEQANRQVAQAQAEVARVEGLLATLLRHGRPTEAVRGRLIELRDVLIDCLERRDQIAGKRAPGQPGGRTEPG